MVECMTHEAIERAKERFAPADKKPAEIQPQGRCLDVPAYLAKYGIKSVKTKTHGTSTLYCLEHCIFDPSHNSNESAIGQTAEGKLFYQCFHNSCEGKTWHEARQIISGNDPLFERNTDLDEIAEERAAIQAESREAERNKPNFEFIHNTDILANLHPIEWRIENVLVENALYYDFGDPGSFKTFVALDRLLSIAAGIDYHGHKTKQGVVFYIAGEGQQGLGRRIAAWHIGHKTRAEDVPFFLAKTPTQLMDKGALDEVRRAVDMLAEQYGDPAVLHIDTLARNFGEGDENATKDMNKVIQNLDSAFGNIFCRGITHHTGHANKERARGSIALHGAADTTFRVSLTVNRQILVECQKMKDAPNSPTMLFDLNEIKLLIDDQKDRSFTLNLTAEGEEAEAAAVAFSNTYKASGNMLKALELLDKMYLEYEKNLAQSGRERAAPRVEIKDWKKTCIEKKIYKRASTFARALESMIERDLIIFDETKTHAYTVSIYLKYKDNIDVFGANCAKL